MKNLNLMQLTIGVGDMIMWTNPNYEPNVRRYGIVKDIDELRESVWVQVTDSEWNPLGLANRWIKVENIKMKML